MQMCFSHLNSNEINQDFEAEQKSVQVSDSQWVIDSGSEVKNIQAFAMTKAEMTNHLHQVLFLYISSNCYMINRCTDVLDKESICHWHINR